jgi:predicted nuclease of predicted toxin-antitoxin system
MNILLDQNVDVRIKEFLESKGFKVDTTYEEGLSTESDRRILEYALENGYVILTHDDDFLSIKDGMEEHPTIIYLSQRIRLREMKRRLESLDQLPETGREVFP